MHVSADSALDAANFRASCLIALLLLAPVDCLQRQAAGQETGDLAKKLVNPISDLVSVPFQFNWENTVGPEHQTRFVLNVQPVMPFSISSKWNLIARVIVPFISQPPLSTGGAATFGLGDITPSFWFSPKVSSFIWGVGPALSLPSTADPALGSGKWSAGPTIVMLKQGGGITIGALANQVWSFAGDAARPGVSQMFLQPFLAYQPIPAVTLAVNSESVANWTVAQDKWTVPINFTVARLSSFGSFPANYKIGWGIYAAHPEICPTWKLRSEITILLPRASR
jgi:hypothetical protein